MMDRSEVGRDKLTEHQVVGSFLVVGAEQEEGAVRLLGEKLLRGKRERWKE